MCAGFLNKKSDRLTVLELTYLVKIKTLLDDFYNKFIKTVTKTISASDKPAVIQNTCQLLKSSLTNCIVTLVASEGIAFTTMIYFL